MRYASVCDGIGAVHVAWQPLGWHCEWTAEIDAFPTAVVEQRWGFPNRGDMTRFKEWDDAPIELLVGGTPCQSFSVAGLRKGLHDPRGGLMLTFLEIAQRYRPQWVVWENVPGVLSSNGGRDFGAFLGALGELGYGWAYRVLDAQWFGVAQRRRRVFVVGCLGDERRAAQVLFESESVRRDNPPSRKAGQGAAAAASSGTDSGGESQPYRIVNCLTQRMHKGINTTCDEGQTPVVAFHPTQDPISSQDGLVHALGTGSSGGCATAAVCFSAKDHGGDASEEVAPTMRSMGHDGSHANGGGQLAVAVGTDLYSGAVDGDVAHSVRAGNGNAMGGVPSVMVQPFTKSKRAQSTTDDESWVPGEVAPTFNCFDQGDTRATTVVAFKPGQSEAAGAFFATEDFAPTLQSASNGSTAVPAVAFHENSRNELRTSDTAWAVTSGGGKPGQSYPAVMQPVAVRTAQTSANGHGVSEGVCHTLDQAQGQAVMTPMAFTTEQTPKFKEDCALTMTKQSPSGGGQPQCVMTPMAVRRLTPRECERLQGFPDDYTAITYRNKPAADGPRYKALGNSMAVPVMAWIGQRIAKCAIH